MTTSRLVWSAWTDYLPEPVRGYLEGPLGIVVLIVVLAIAVYLLAAFAGSIWRSLFGSAAQGPESALRERLADYPPPPGRPGARRITVEGVPGRLRLVVVAPVGKNRPLDKDNIEDVLNKCIRGLGDIVQRDKPRIRFWPPQLSSTGFAPTFHRLTEVPGAEGESSHWVLVAGPAHATGQPLLLGLAILADHANDLGRLSVTADRWSETVRVQTIDA